MKNEPKAPEALRIDGNTRAAALRRAVLAVFPLFALAAFPAALSAQTRTEGGGRTVVENKIELNKTIHDFGDVTLSDEKLKCSFRIKNISKKPAVIYNIVSSCGCTDVDWPRKPLAPGEAGVIEATYTNDSGPYPFDKSLTVYVSDLRKPVILRLRGIVHRIRRPMSENYPVRFGSLGFKTTEFRLGNLTQGDCRGDSFPVANFGKTPLKLTFADVSEQLWIRADPNPIPPNSEAKILFNVSADRRKWGDNRYWFTPVANDRKLFDRKAGRSVPVRLAIRAYTKEDFSAWSKEEIKNGAQPFFDTGFCTIPAVRAGGRVTGEFHYTNKGKSVSRLYKVDSEMKEFTASYDKEVPPGGKGRIQISFSTDGMPKGEFMSLLTLTTNSPLRPIINLYIYGKIK